MNSEIRKKKRGRPKKESPNDEGMELETPNKIPKPDPSQPEFEPLEEEFKIKKKVKIAVAEPVTKQKMDNHDFSYERIYLHPPTLNLVKTFYEILGLSNKNEDFLILLSNILTTGSRQLNEKKTLLRKRRNTLQGSNLSQLEYLKRERELLKSEQEETQEVKDSIFSRLSTSKIKGFESREQLLQTLKNSHINSEKLDFELDEKEYQEYRALQMNLLDKLLEEKTFVNPDLKISMSMGKYGKSELEQNLNIVEIERTKQEIFKEHENVKEEVKGKKIMLYKLLEEGEISEKDSLNERIKNVFESFEDFLKIKKDETFIVNKYEKANVLEQKSDYLYIDEKFQKYQFAKFSKLIKEIEGKNENDLKKLDDDLLLELVKLTTYILNNVHYFQKFKLDSEFVNPYDLLYVLEKIK